VDSRRPWWLRLKEFLLGGGEEGNERLTATTAVVLLALLAIEGVTILRIRQLLSPHEFVGVLLIPPVVLKLVSTGYRFVSYYRGRPAYVRKGPPALLLRVLVAPVLVLATLGVFVSGVALLVLHKRNGSLVGIHKAAFLVWVGAFGLHVLAYVWRIPRVLAREWRERLPGRRLRYGVVAGALALGLVVALATLPFTDHWRDQNLPHQLDVN
jgi:hypothetical protein